MSNQATRRPAASTSSNATAGSPATPDQKRHFDLHATGLGYLNRPRMVPVKGKGNDYLAVDIAALRGEPGNVTYTHFSCRVSGREAQRVIREELADHVKAGKPVLVRFKVGDLEPDSFVFKSGKREGETAVNIKSHLLFLYWAKVGDEYIYEAPAREETPAQTPAVAAPVVAEQPQNAPPKGRVFAAARDVSNHGLSDEEVDAQVAEIEGVG